MPCGGFHAYHRLSGVLNELVEDLFVVIIFLTLETGERPNPDNVCIASHYGDGLEKMFRFISVHYHAAFGLEIPCSLLDIQHNNVHTQVLGGFLCTQPRT